MRTAIKSLTPAVLSGDKFRGFDERGDFRTFCEANKPASFRLFSVRQVDPPVPPDVSNLDQEQWTTSFEVQIAYPNDYRYGDVDALDRDDCIDRDMRLVRDRIGCTGYSRLDVSSGGDATVADVGWRRDETDTVTFVVLDLTAMYWRAMP